MSASVATHVDTGVVTEAKLARRKRDVRGRSAGASPDSERMDEEAVASGDAHAKHLPNQHDQASHAGSAKGAAARKAGEPGTYSAKAGEFTADSGKKISVEQAAGYLYDMAMQGFGGSEAGEAGESESSLAAKDFFSDWSGDNAANYLAQEYRAMSREEEPSINADNPEWKRFAEDARDNVLSSDQYFTKSMLPLVEKFIRKKGSQWCVVSKKGKNLGCSPSRAGAAKRLAAVEYFKSMAEEEIVAGLDSGALQVSDVVLKSWMDLEERRGQFSSVVAKHFPPAPCPECGSTAVDPHIGRGTHKCKECGAEYQPQEEKHLPGQHDQSSHAGAGSAAWHTPAQMRDAAARLFAKDAGISIAAARKVVGSGAKVPTTRRIKTPPASAFIVPEPSAAKLTAINAAEVARLAQIGGATEEEIYGTEEYQELYGTKSLIAKADQACLKSIWGQYYKYYSGKWIAAAWGLYQKGQYAQAAQAFAKARDGFQPDKNPNEYKCLDAWQQESEGKGGEKKHLAGQHDQSSHAGAHSDYEHSSEAFQRFRSEVMEKETELTRLTKKLQGKSTKHPDHPKLKAEQSRLEKEVEKLRVHLEESGKNFWETRETLIKQHGKSLVTKAEMDERSPVRFAAPMVNWDWVINKARTLPDGTMEWTATTTKFARDVQRDLVRRSFYEEAIRRFKSKVVPPPFVSVAHYRAAETCLDCGHVYKGLATYICPTCKAERVLAGICTDMWIDGQQPKARGKFYPTEVGRAAFESVLLDIRKSLPLEERNRVSMGFYPDVPDGIIYTKAGRDFLAGWCEHFALTRVPVVAETDITARMVHP